MYHLPRFLSHSCCLIRVLSKTAKMTTGAKQHIRLHLTLQKSHKCTPSPPQRKKFQVILPFRRIDVFELWCWRRLLRVPWTARRSNQSIAKEISPEYSLEWLMLKLQYFGHLMWRTDLLERTLMLGKIEGRRRRDDRGWNSCMASLTL